MTQAQRDKIYSNERIAPKKTARISPEEREIIAKLNAKYGRA